jgi:hypothetical protein
LFSERRVAFRQSDKFLLVEARQQGTLDGECAVAVSLETAEPYVEDAYAKDKLIITGVTAVST